MNTDFITNVLNIFKSISEYVFTKFNNPKMGVNHKNSHIRKDTGKPKMPLSKTDANKEALRWIKNGENMESYKCPKCGAYHVGHCPNTGYVAKFQNYMLCFELIVVLFNLYLKIKSRLHK